MTHSLMAHCILTEPVCKTMSGKGREGKGRERKGKEVGGCLTPHRSVGDARETATDVVKALTRP